MSKAKTIRKTVKVTGPEDIVAQVKTRSEVFLKCTENIPTRKSFSYAIKKKTHKGLEYLRRAMSLSTKLEKTAKKNGNLSEVCKTFEEKAMSFPSSALWQLYIMSCGAEAQGTSANKVGNNAKNKVKDLIAQRLKSLNRNWNWDNENKRKRLFFSSKNKSKLDRVILFDTKCPITKRNMDFMLLRFDDLLNEKQCREDPSQYLAIGELKGGQDSASIGERYKETHSTLITFQEKAKNEQTCKAFVILAKITSQVADDLNSSSWWDQCAYLNSKKELVDLTNWLLSL